MRYSFISFGEIGKIGDAVRAALLKNIDKMNWFPQLIFVTPTLHTRMILKCIILKCSFIVSVVFARLNEIGCNNVHWCDNFIW